MVLMTGIRGGKDLDMGFLDASCSLFTKKIVQAHLQRAHLTSLRAPGRKNVFCNEGDFRWRFPCIRRRIFVMNVLIMRQLRNKNTSLSPTGPTTTTPSPADLFFRLGWGAVHA